MQLTLINQFDKSTTRQQYLVDSLIKEIGVLKYYRTLSEFGKMGNEKLITTILYWTAMLAHRQSKGLAKYKGQTQADFMDRTLDGVNLNITDGIDTNAVWEYYRNGYQRMRTLLMGSRDLLKDDMTTKNRILTHYETLINDAV
jgi:hypothetical protein